MIGYIKRLFFIKVFYIRCFNVFYKKHGYKPNLKQPKTFNEKILYRKIKGNLNKMAFFADKFLVRDFVKEKIGNEYLIPLLHSTNFLNASDVNNLPNKFVIKTNHASGDEHVSIVDNFEKITAESLVVKFNSSIKQNYGLNSGEVFYDCIPRKIIVEKYLDSGMLTPDDYKFHCFNSADGNINIYVQVDRGRFSEHYRNIYNDKWELQDFIFDQVPNFINCNKPDNFSEMICIAKKLATNFDYIRVDLYNIDGNIFFGELTQTPNNGMADFPKEWDNLFGELWSFDNAPKNYYR